MMNDRFSAQLRQHLLDTADERPGDGQLAALVERVAVTGQRHPLAVRLAWFPGRIGPVPSAAVRYGLIAAALLGAIAGAAMLGGGAVPIPGTVFEGTWTSTDPADGSTQILVVGEGTSPEVHFEDQFATGAACRRDVVKLFTADGSGELSGNRLDVSFPEGGGCVRMKVPMTGVYYDYDPRTDSLLDHELLRWVRVRDVDEPATQPSPTDVPTASPSVASAMPVPGCIDFGGGGTYRATAGSLSLTVTVPATADAPWHGLRDSFYLVRAPCLFGGPAWLEASLVDQVYADACDWAGTGVDVATPAEAADALAAQGGLEMSGPSGVSLDGYTASRFDLSVPADFDATTCAEGTVRLLDGVSNLDPGQTLAVYLVDVSGTTLALAINAYERDATPALIAEVDAIVSSLAIDP